MISGFDIDKPLSSFVRLCDHSYIDIQKKNITCSSVVDKIFIQLYYLMFKIALPFTEKTNVYYYY